MHLDNPAWVLNPSKSSLPQGNRTVWPSWEFSPIIWLLLSTGTEPDTCSVSLPDSCADRRLWWVFLEKYILSFFPWPSSKAWKPLPVWLSVINFLPERRQRPGSVEFRRFLWAFTHLFVPIGKLRQPACELAEVERQSCWGQGSCLAFLEQVWGLLRGLRPLPPLRLWNVWVERKKKTLG